MPTRDASPRSLVPLRHLIAITLITPVLFGCSDATLGSGVPTSPAPLRLTLPEIPPRPVSTFVPSTFSALPPELPTWNADGTADNEKALILSANTETGFEADHAFAIGTMSYFGTHATQTVTLSISGPDNAPIGAPSVGAEMQTDVIPWVRHMGTPVSQRLSQTCDLTLNGKTDHEVWIEVLTSVMVPVRLPGSEGRPTYGSTPRTPCPPEMPGGGGGGGDSGGGAWQVCVWRIYYDEYGFLGEELLGCYLTDNLYDVLPV